MNDVHERTEQATPRRRARAASEGQTSRSTAFAAALSVFAAALPCAFAFSGVVHWVAMVRSSSAVAVSAATSKSPNEFISLLGRHSPLVSASAAVISIAGACAIAAAVLAAGASGPLAFAPRALMPRLDRLSWVAGARRVLSRSGIAPALVATLATAAILLCALPAARAVIESAAGAPAFSAQMVIFGRHLRDLWLRAGVVIAAIAGADLASQRIRHAQRLRMTPREVRDERAQSEGRPEVRARRRSATMRRGRTMRLLAVRKATAVVTNPTHLAVALRYAPPQIDVPTVVARGADHAAAALRTLAELHDVPIVESPDLARALYERVNLEDAIPEDCYAAVAAIFAWLLRTRGQLRGAA